MANHAIFISYASADRAKAQALASLLEERGFSCFWDRTIPTGMTWDAVIENALDNAQAVIVLWSPTAVKSEWVRIEAAAAADKGLLLPAFIERTDLPLRFRAIQAADLCNWNGTGTSSEIENLIRSVEERIGEKKVKAVEPGDSTLLDSEKIIWQRSFSRRKMFIFTLGAVSTVAAFPAYRIASNPWIPFLHGRHPRFVQKRKAQPVAVKADSVEKQAVALANTGLTKEALELIYTEIKRDIEQKKKRTSPHPPSFRLWDLYAVIAIRGHVDDFLPRLVAIANDVGPTYLKDKRTSANLTARIQKWSASESAWRSKSSESKGRRSWAGLLM